MNQNPDNLAVKNNLINSGEESNVVFGKFAGDVNVNKGFVF